MGVYCSRICTNSKDKKSILLNADCSKVDFFTFDGYTTDAKVVYIYDGDSVHVVFFHPDTNKLIKVKTRLYGIDTPELRVKEQKEKALKAKQYLIELLEKDNYMVTIECKQFDKYGRLLIILYSSQFNKSLNEILVDEGHAYRYFGDTKKMWI